MNMHGPKTECMRLLNHGNTCYINACLQALSTHERFVAGCQAFRRFMEAEDPRILQCAVAQRFPQFRTMEQQDAHEWLLHALELLDTEKTCTGTMTVTVEYDECGHHNLHDEDFVTLSLPLVGGSMLEAMRDYFLSKDSVESACDKCDDGGKTTQRAWKSVKINDLPLAGLIVHWKRFDGCAKLSRAMDVPQEMMGMRLKAVILHQGGLAGGHYTACVTVCVAKKTTYWHASDTDVREITESQFLDVARHAYLLFYS